MPYDTDMFEEAVTGLPADAGRFIPQKPPFVFVTSLEECSEKHAVTFFDVSPDCILSAGNVLREGGLVEFMAQSCAAYAGYRDFLVGKTEPEIGVLGALSAAEFYFLPETGSRLTCNIEVIGDFDGMLLFYAKVFSGDRLVCEGRLTTSGLHENMKI